MEPMIRQKTEHGGSEALKLPFPSPKTSTGPPDWIMMGGLDGTRLKWAKTETAPLLSVHQDSILSSFLGFLSVRLADMMSQVLEHSQLLRHVSDADQSTVSKHLSSGRSVHAHAREECTERCMADAAPCHRYKVCRYGGRTDGEPTVSRRPKLKEP